MHPLVLLLALAAPSQVTTEDAPTVKPIATWKGAEQTICELAYSPDGRLLATADDDGDVKLWHAATHALVRTLKSHKGRIDRGEIDGVKNVEVVGGVESIAFAPDGRTLASIGGDSKIKLWDVATGALAKTLGEFRYSRSLAFSPDGALLAVVGNNADDRHALCVFDVKGGRKVRQIQADEIDVFAVAFSPDSSLVAASGDKGAVLIYDAKTGKPARRINTGAPTTLAVAFAPDGKTLAAKGAGCIAIFDAKTGREASRLEGLDSALDLKFSPDGKRLAASSRDGAVRIWDVASRKEPVDYEGHEDIVRTVAFAPDGRTLASADKAGVVKLWAVPGVGGPTVPAAVSGAPGAPPDPTPLALRFDGIVRPGEAEYNRERTSVRLRFGPGRWAGTVVRSSVVWGDGNQGQDHWGQGAGEPTFASKVQEDVKGAFFIFSLNGVDWESNRAGALIRLTLPDGKPAVATALFPIR
ncbi:MAG: WD40 repeat domain-containing protein [Paludisphaera borealis]|uniref:WD40 repeat domain-containing protein n=1 Tax=Paludisphaera borealis TaxID=1387353 RepID=UPI002845EAA8|nr:WD40 repeat domain-containing protein [Paludisphaera borealis]MDR3623166.1 WD40 repeat domain-containing protein [Paludisphaera borealis]